MTSQSAPPITDKGSKSQGYFLEIINSLEDGYFEADLAGNMLLTNAAMYRLFGYSEEEAVGMNYKNYTDSEVAKEVYQKFNRVYKTGIPEKDLEYEIIKKGGKRASVDVSVSLIRDENDKIIGFRGVVRDATDRKRIEKQLRLSEIRYRSILEEIQEVYFEADLNGMISFCNSALEATLEYTNQEIIGKDYKQFFGEQDKTVSMHVSQILEKDGLSTPIEMKLIAKSGKLLTMESRIFSIKDENGKCIGYRGVARDITARKRAEEALIKHQNHLEDMVEKRTAELLEAKVQAELANRAKSEFLANISHELRTPLHGLLSFSRIGIERIESSDKESNIHYYQRINQSGYRLMFLVDDLLDIANLESGKIRFNMAVNDLSSLTHFVIQGFGEKLKEKGIRLTFNKVEISTQLACDSNKITHVIKNLLSNAIRYSDENTEIVVTIEESTSSKTKTHAASLQFSILDQGVGIPEDELEIVFGKFKQSSRTNTGAGGIGLGLAICQEIILGHEGKIWAECHPEGGTKVSFTLPKDSSFI